MISVCSCDIENKKRKFQDPTILTESELETVLQNIYLGTISVNSLDVVLYAKVADYLKEGIFEGFGQTLITAEFGSPDYIMLKNLVEDVQVFSGAKSFQMVKEMSALLKDGNRLVPFAEFKKAATALYEDYNINWLRAEYQAAVGGSRMASYWNEIIRDKKELPLLKYQTIGDDRVRPEHRTLDDIIKPVGDKFWNTHYPPNGWSCRCTVGQLEEGEVSTIDIDAIEKPNKLFSFNPGKEQRVFSPRHPYYKVQESYKSAARTNFGLPIN